MKKNLKNNKLSYKRIFCTILLISGGIIGIFIIFGNKPTLSHTEISYKKIHVSSGETLWEIASRETKNNSCYLGKDVRFVINHIKKTNHLKTSSLSTGQELLIPEL